jgi:hypothetical protein
MSAKERKGRGRRIAVVVSATLGAALLVGSLASSAGAATATYSNDELIAVPLPPADDGNAAPYPSNIEVSGLPGTVTELTVKFEKYIHSFPDDVGAVMIGPNGQGLLLMREAGDGDPAIADLTFNDGAAFALPDETPLSTGTYRPTNYDATTPDFPAPGPGTTYANPGPAGAGTATLNGTFGGIDPNGTWQLFVEDFAGGDSGAIANGWKLTVSTTQPPDTQITSGPPAKTKQKSATIAFGSTVPGTTFECALDGKTTFRPCASPETVKVKKGKHTFQVQAVDEAGEVDPTPATDSWKVKKKKKKR